MKKWMSSPKVAGTVLAITAFIGLVASFALLSESFAAASDPTYVPACNINPVLSCQSAMASEQAEVFLGIPNPALGIAAFMALLTFAVLLWSGAKFARWVWQAVLAAATGGLIFALFLYSTALWVLGAVCPWCFVTWIVCVAIFWMVVTHVFATKAVRLPNWLKGFSKVWLDNATLILASSYAILIMVIVIRFREALLG